MNNRHLIKVSNVSKKYCKDLKKSLWYGIKDITKEIIGYDNTNSKLRTDEFWSLRDISFDLSRGECIGLIGKNGAGKSSLLKLLNGLIKPDSGYIQIEGRVGALIELGAGFSPLLTGRENIYINGAVLGLSKKEIDEKLDEIIDFAELDDFIDSPVQNYSSGMKVRLGFAIASQISPDILFIDEVLAVGDFRFRQKCAQKINEIKENTAIILVSHNMRDIKMLCTKAILLEDGKIVYTGDPKNTIDCYHDIISNNLTSDKNTLSKNNSVYGDVVHTATIEKVRCKWVDISNEQAYFINHGEALKLEFSFKITKPVSNLIIGIPIWDENDTMVTSFNTDISDITIKVAPGGFVTGHLLMPGIIFNPGRYKSVFVVVENREYLFRDFIDDFVTRENTIYFGCVTPEHQWHFEHTIGTNINEI